MESGYKIFWTENAISELKSAFDYFELNWTQKSIIWLTLEIEKTITLISKNPEIFQKTDKYPEIRRAVISKNSSLYYSKTENSSKLFLFSQIDKILRRET